MSSSYEVLHTVQWAITNGFKIVPLLLKSKTAVSGDYAKSGYVSPPLAYWQTNDCNVGLVTGPLSNSPVDVDIDGGEDARHFARLFLPSTEAVFGRPSNPLSHYLYCLKESVFDKFAILDPVTRKCIIEARGDGGHQTVLPGSFHPSGEQVVWALSQSPVVPQLPAASLIHAVRKVALATIVARHVWKPGYHNEPCKHLSGMLYYSDWSKDETVEFIQAIMDFTGDDDSARIPTVHLTFSRAAKGRKVTAGGRLREQIGDQLVNSLFSLMATPDQESFANKLASYNERFAIVNFAGRFQIARTDLPPGTIPTFMDKGDFTALHAFDAITDREGKKRRFPDLWIACPQACRYSAVETLPGDDSPDSDIFNLWTGFAIPPGEGTCTAWLKLARLVCGTAEGLEWFLNWLSGILKTPQIKPGTAPVIIGDPGAGKTTLIKYFGEILGDYYVPVTHESHLTGNFNAHRAMAILIHSEEALYGGDKRHRGIIKSLITDEYQMYERKGVDAVRVRSYNRLILSTNSTNPAPVEPGDRRFNIFDMGKVKAPEPLITAVFNERNHLNGQAALHQMLLNLTPNVEMARVPLKVETGLEITAQNLDPIDAIWLDMLKQGEILPLEGKWCQRPTPTDMNADDESLRWPVTVSTAALYRVFELKLKHKCPPAWAAINTVKKRFLQGRVTEKQGRFIPPDFDDMSVPSEWRRGLGSRQRAIEIPPLAECRRIFEDYLAQPVEWGSDEFFPDPVAPPKSKRPDY